jgi:hypothetical protein
VYYHRAGVNAREGPYLIAAVRSAGKYTLCSEDGSSALGGVVVEERELERA